MGLYAVMRIARIVSSLHAIDCLAVTAELALQWLPCQAAVIMGSALGLVGPVSVYCDWVR